MANGTFRVGYPRINGLTLHDPGFPGIGVEDCSGFNNQEDANTVNIRVYYDFEFIMPYMDFFVTDGVLTLTAQSDSTILYPPCD